MTLPAIIEPEDPRYPIGQLALPKTLTPQARQAAIDELAAFPQQLSAAIADLTEAQLDTPYRQPINGDEVWTLRQLLHHLADSHATAYCWMRLALTNPPLPESWPTVYAYDPAAIAKLEDSHLPAQISLQLLEALHQRWTSTLQSVPGEDWQTRGYLHPETGPCSLEQTLAMYAWHGHHHLTQILNCRQRHNWI